MQPFYNQKIERDYQRLANIEIITNYKSILFYPKNRTQAKYLLTKDNRDRRLPSGYPWDFFFKSNVLICDQIFRKEKQSEPMY